MLDAAEEGINIAEVGHFASERPVCSRLRSLILEADPDLYVEVLTVPTLNLL